jgi:hypothetical protein
MDLVIDSLKPGASNNVGQGLGTHLTLATISWLNTNDKATTISWLNTNDKAKASGRRL